MKDHRCSVGKDLSIVLFYRQSYDHRPYLATFPAFFKFLPGLLRVHHREVLSRGKKVSLKNALLVVGSLLLCIFVV